MPTNFELSNEDELELIRLSIIPVSSRDELLARFKALKASGMNKKQCILALWGFKKGGGKNYQRASVFYGRLLRDAGLELPGDISRNRWRSYQ